MSVIISSGELENIKATIDNSVDLNIVKALLPPIEVDEILQLSGQEGIRCWGLTKTQEYFYNALRAGDELLIKQNGTNSFTRFGIVIRKRESPALAKELWSKERRQYVYFLANVREINIDKDDIVNAADNVEKPRIISYNDPEVKFLNGNTISMHYKIPVLENIRNIKPKVSYYAENIPTQTTRRQGHQDFASLIKENYNYECAICGITEPEFLVAAHISRWADDEENRINPANGMCLCALHDRAFEYGYIAIDDALRVVISSKLSQNSPLYSMLKTHENSELKKPLSNEPSLKFLKKHREKFGF